MAVVSNALCTFEEFLLYNEGNQYKSAGDSDSLIKELINYKTQEIHNYCGVVQFKSRQYTERYDGIYSDKLFVNKTPIISISSIYDDVDWNFTSDTLIDSSNYVIDTSKKYIQLKPGYIFNCGSQNIKIIYTAGYETIPNDIKLVCIKEVTREFRRRINFDVSAVTLNDGNISYVEKGLLKSSKDILDKYRTIGIC